GDAPPHPAVSFEVRDFQACVIYKYLFALGVAVVASAFICIFVLRYPTAFTASIDSPPPPSRETHQRELPPEPRLQGFGFPGQKADPQADLRKKIQDDTEAKEKLEWIDRSSGIVQIPVKDAMEIVAEQGLSPAPAASTEKKK